MLTAITRAVGDSMETCQLEYLERQAIDIAKAAAQHRAYQACLEELGVSVIALAAEPGLPDAVFVEDPAVVLDEVAVMTRMGTESRRAESSTLERELARFRPLRWLRAPATLEGGDVMRVGRAIFVGLSPRTNAEGIQQLAAELEPLGYTVRPVDVRGCLHLKTACSHVGNGRVLVNRAWVDAAAFEGLQVVDVPAGEEWAANVLTVRETALAPAGFPETARLLGQMGWRVRTLDISEFRKAEAGLTCLSLLFAV